MNDSGTLLALGHPLVVILIAIALLALWRGDKQRQRYLLLFGLSYLAYAVGVTSQIIMVPTSYALNVIFSGLMYLMAVTIFSRGVVELSGSPYRYGIPVVIVTVAMACRAYFLVVQPDGAIRAYVLHGAVSLLFLHGAYLARNLGKGLLAEKVTLYALVLFALATPPRMLLQGMRSTDSYGFDQSTYWAVTTLSIYVFSLVFFLALIVTIIQRHYRQKQTSLEQLSLISHDLRAPLATIVGNLYLLQKTATAEQMEHMSAIERSTNYQMSLIEDILRQRDGGSSLSVNLHRIPLRPFLAELCLHGRAWCLQHNISFSLTVHTPLPGQIHSDERRLKQLLLNLLSNAALATDQGSVALHVKNLGDEPGWARMCFEVHDTGSGIEAQHQAKLFDPYQRFDLEREGTGLGLYIAKRITDKLHGKLDVNSEYGKGSCFSLTLRVEASEINAIHQGWQPTATSDSHQVGTVGMVSGVRTEAIPNDAALHGLPRCYTAPPSSLCEQLASHAKEGRYSDIEDWVSSPLVQNPEYRDFRSAVVSALGRMDFDEIHALACSHASLANPQLKTT